MFNQKQLRQQLHQEIDKMQANQLIELEDWLQKKRKKETILKFAGSWSDLDSDAPDDEMFNRRQSHRRERFND